VTRYRTIVADPPWAYRVATGVQGAVGVQYGTMTNAAIAGLPVSTLADNDAHLYMWVTNPRLFAEPHDDCGPIDIFRAWGFEYKTMLTWVKKPGLGIGYYFRGDTEHVLFGIRGKAPIPPPLRESNVLTAPRRGHSAKPECFYDLVERVSPGPYVELFARRARFGWDYWGNESLGTAQMEARDAA
jgi:N6-adenosine-specific RNA methylase IME4